MKPFFCINRIPLTKSQKILILFGSVVCLTSCTKTIDVPVNLNDKTPPVVIWTLKNETKGTETTFPAGDVVYNDGDWNDNFIISAVASDDGGLKEVDNSVAVSYSCGDGEAESNTSSVSGVNKVPMNIVNGRALPSWPVSFDEYTLNLPCQSGYNFLSGGIAFICEATNAANLKTRATLTINGKP